MLRIPALLGHRHARLPPDDRRVLPHQFHGRVEQLPLAPDHPPQQRPLHPPHRPQPDGGTLSAAVWYANGRNVPERPARRRAVPAATERVRRRTDRRRSKRVNRERREEHEKKTAKTPGTPREKET